MTEFHHYCIQVMITEHTNITAFLQVLRSACIGILQGAAVCGEDFSGFIQFARMYSDTYHHGKEERFLFNRMSDKLGTAGKILVQHGMLVEHDLGRSLILDLETAVQQYTANPDEDSKLDIIASAAGYARLLTRHIEKENSAVYPFAERGLSQQLLDEIDMLVHQFESDRANTETREALLNRLSAWQKKYTRSYV